MDLIISAATHRSGSTLLQRIFNTRKQTLIWGEQDGLLTHFYQIHRKLKHYSEDLKDQRTNYFNRNEDPNVWIACMNPEMEYVDKAVQDSLKLLLNSLYEQYREDHDIVGFKEVRYGENELTLFRRCYPETKFILLVRNPIDVFKSMMGSGLGGNVIPFSNKWIRNAGYYLQLAESDPNAYLIKYEDIINNNSKTIELISELGKLTTEDINKVISKKIFSTPREITIEQEKYIIDQCGDIMKQYGYL